MRGNRYILMTGGAAFVAILLYATLRTTSAPLGADREAGLAAQRECQRAIRATLADARFPFDATSTALADGAVRLSGSVDSGEPSDAQRRNYDCFMRLDAPAGTFVADSVHVWQSH